MFNESRIGCLPTRDAARTKLLAALVLSSNLLTSCTASPSVGEAVAALTNGSPDDVDQTVVALGEPNGVIECTGTLVAPNIVLTAAHCLAGLTIDHIVVGDTDGGSTSTVAVVAAHQHPAFDLESLSNDIAVLELAAPIELEPSPVELSIEPALGDSLLVVGYGRTGEPRTDGGALAERRSGHANVSEVDETTLQLMGAPSQPCEGDSGGPIFESRDGRLVLIGVTSFGDPQCTSFAVATRTDAFADFLGPWLERDRPASCAMQPTHSGHSLGYGLVGVILLLALRACRRGDT